jgi:hypothetical protein
VQAGPNPNVLEICFNLWLFVDNESRLIYCYAGKIYAMRGEDDEKLRRLRELSADDHHTVPRRKLPDRFKLILDEGEMMGVATLSISRDSNSQFFEELFAELEKELPQQTRFVFGGFIKTSLPVSKTPLCVTTVILEDKFGIPHPQVSPDSH